MAFIGYTEIGIKTFHISNLSCPKGYLTLISSYSYINESTTVAQKQFSKEDAEKLNSTLSGNPPSQEILREVMHITVKSNGAHLKFDLCSSAVNQYK